MLEDDNKQLDLNETSEVTADNEAGEIISESENISESVIIPEGDVKPEEEIKPEEVKDSEDVVKSGDDVKLEEETKPEESVNTDEAENTDEELTAEEVVASETETSAKKASKGFKLEKGTTAYEVFDWLRTICIGVLAGVFIVVFLIQRDNVYGDSMVPTLSSGDVVYAQKISNYFKSYKRGDIVVLDGHDMEGYNSKEYLIKRIVGLPGETVRIDNGHVFIKPEGADEFFLLMEDYLPNGVRTSMREEGLRKGYNEVTLGENEYYVLGDNRPVSNDSRNLGPFTNDRIKGVAIIRVYPLNEMKLL
jgi:signal peptidase I